MSLVRRRCRPPWPKLLQGVGCQDSEDSAVITTFVFPGFGIAFSDETTQNGGSSASVGLCAIFAMIMILNVLSEVLTPYHAWFVAYCRVHHRRRVPNTVLRILATSRCPEPVQRWVK